jgi:hypothetical protein
MNAVVESRTYKSLENRFMIVPTGVTSKNVLIGAFITLVIIYSWRMVEALMLIKNMIPALAATNNPVPVANESV